MRLYGFNVEDNKKYIQPKNLLPLKVIFFIVYSIDIEFKNSRFRQDRKQTGLNWQQASPAGLTPRRAF